MASTNLTKDEFADYVVAFLLDKMIKPKEILPQNEDFNKLTKDMKSRGLDKLLLFYYLNSNALVRSKYKATRKVFTPGSKDALTLGIRGGVEKEKKTKSTLKSLVMKSLKLMSAQKRRIGFPLSEKRVDRIIERVMIEEGFLMEDKE